MADAQEKKEPAPIRRPKAKKKKMSKAEKDKLKKEEQERKAQEEEIAKQRAMEEAKKQKKEEAAQAIERAKQENEERKRRREDMTELQEILDRNQKALVELNQARRVQAKWARYMRCDGSPDPVNQGEINTYINLKLEDKSRNDAESVLKDTQLDLALIDELQFLLVDTPAEELSEDERSLYHETIGELEKLIGVKLDLGTLQILCDATVLANSETGNLQHVARSDQIALCVWGNIMKNPRIKSFEIPEVHYTFDIPRVLGLSDCAVRVLITKFDHFSPSSKAAIPRRKKKEEEPPPEPTEAEGEEKKEGEEEEKVDGEKEGEEEAEKEETEIDLMAALRGETTTEEEPKEEEEVQEEPEPDFEDPATPEPTEWEDFDEEDDIIDLRANDVLGGVYQFNLLHMPPQPKTVGSWTLTQLVDPPEIQVMDYVADPPANVEDKKDNKDAKKDEKPPINVSMILPDDVLFLEEPQVARWDYKRKFWTTQGFSDFNFNEDARTFSFKTTHFGTLCLLQDSHINMPFQSWELRPHKLDSAVLTITAAIVEIEIEIKDALCCLSQPKDKPELESIRNKWVTPVELIRMLKKAGVNVFPSEDSSKFVSIQNKHPLIEERMYQQMALTASAMAYSWSKWNGEREREEIVFQAAEALEDEPLLEEDWSVFLATKRRVMKLKMTEFDDAFTEEAEGEGESKGDSKTNSKDRLPTAEGSIRSFDSDRRTKSSSKASLASSQIGKRSITQTGSSSRIFGFSKTGVAGRPTISRGSSKFVKSKLKKSAIHEIKEEEVYVDLLWQIYDYRRSLFKSNIYHLMPDITSETAQTRVKDTNFQFVDCVEQLLKATKVLTYA